MGLAELVDGIREAGGARVWGAGVKLARDGAVRGVSDDGEEVCLHVKCRGRATPYEVYLWPDEEDWGCDCGLPGDACVHVAAAAISLQQARADGAASLPAPKKAFQVALHYAFSSVKSALSVQRRLRWPDGREERLDGALADTDALVSREDAAAEGLLVMHPGGPLNANHLRRLLALMGPEASASLDGEPVTIDVDPVYFRIRVTDEGEGFKLGLYSPRGYDRFFRGAALRDGVLAPTTHGDLLPEQRRMLVRGVHFGPDEVGVLVSETLPKLRLKAPVDIETERLPKQDALRPRVALKLTERPDGLEVKAQVVYGDPPVARITDAGMLEKLSEEVVPARDVSAERTVARAFQERLGLPVGIPRRLPPEEAASFLADKLPLHDGPVKGRVAPDRFKVHRVKLVPELDVRPIATDESERRSAGWHLDVTFDSDDGAFAADPLELLSAWRNGRSLVPLLDGGYAPLPATWLRDHGPLLAELLEARDRDGRVERNATAALVELLEDTKGEVPPDLRRLRGWLEGGDGLPEVPPPDGLRADLRPYQRAGFQWLRFLRDMDLNGILADDMGLGKTLQALVAMLDAGGQHLVVAPTSVLSNWANEARRFVPQLKVNVYHGPDRRLDPDAHITLTSYALMRLDRERLGEIDWTYLVLDEAQAIKNARSQTARAAFGLRAHNRLCLTGTPVENRLEELWSLFRFLMPGLLGSEKAFRDRFVKPIEAGDSKARQLLRGRVKPYVLRRLKKQVATELPPLTEQVVRCALEPAQRKVYDTVRLAARADVQRALAEAGRASTMQVLEALLRMRQACCDPSLLPGDIGAGAGAAKLDRMEELLVELVAEDHKALVFSQWTSLLDRAQARLDELGIPWVRLDGSTRNRQGVIEHFQSDDGPPVFLLSLKAGGTGLNLTNADYVLHLDPWWNPAVERQATDRAHRIGQDKPVVSFKLIAEGTVEERILELQDAKRDLAEAAIGAEGGFVKALSAEELRSLFDVD